MAVSRPFLSLHPFVAVTTYLASTKITASYQPYDGLVSSIPMSHSTVAHLASVNGFIEIINSHYPQLLSKRMHYGVLSTLSN
ncbi:hypothetical protein QCA50_010882 [Cerrena zonata]|uniref:Uncharacterized protein n=1 Tax=Cerrena zonata TaxID=2478898 RepID=A0AAW0FXX6_9APHY